MMQKVKGISGIVLGVVGALLCAAVIGMSWWFATKSTTRMDRMTSRLIQGLAEVDGHLTRVQSRFNSIQSELKTVQNSVTTIAAENPELPRVKAAVESMLEKMIHASERVDALTDSVRSISAGLRTAADLIENVKPDARATARAREVADKIDHAAELLKSVQTKIEESKLNKAVEMTQELVGLVRRTVEGCDRLSEGLAGAREEVATLTRRTNELRDDAVFWVRVFATTFTFIGLWGGLGQVCLVCWGRRSLRGEI